VSRRSIGSWTLAFGLAALAAQAALAGDRSPPAWSPDGLWLAYVTAVPAIGRQLDLSWIYRGKDDAPNPPAHEMARGAMHYRLWASRAGSDGPSALLDDASGPITPPAWRPDGRREAG
jgi:hypothetical protein